VPDGDEKTLKTKLLLGTMFVLIDASDISFQIYQRGVYRSTVCSKNSVNHAVQLVGYGHLQGVDYWIIKNSWGTSWGMQGFMFIERLLTILFNFLFIKPQYRLKILFHLFFLRGNNMCGIASYAELPY
jgi:hypothetical protein